MIFILGASLFIVSICFIYVILEKAKLEERCSQQKDISLKYNELLEKHSELEKKAVLLSANLELERKNLQEKVKLLENAEQKLSDTFKSISLDALSKNNAAFMDLAKSVFEKFQEKAKSEFSMSAKSVCELMTPIKSALENVDIKLNDLEKNRVGAYEALNQQIKDMMMTGNLLKTETGRLVSALRSPTVRGQWGEVQLRRVVELAGMVEHCDFKEQVTSELNDDGKSIRPDMVIYLPGDKQIIIDAKVPLSAYLEALETNDDKLRKSLLIEHAKQIRSRISTLSNKKYWSQFQESPEFVIMFLPSEVFFSAAIEHDSSLIEFSMQERVIISTPMILLALLNTIALVWRQEGVAEDAKKIIKMGRELYERLSIMSSNMSDLGRSIKSAVQNYNSTVGSFENRVLVSARKFKDLDVHEKNIVELSAIEETAREIRNV